MTGRLETTETTDLRGNTIIMALRGAWSQIPTLPSPFAPDHRRDGGVEHARQRLQNWVVKFLDLLQRDHLIVAEHDRPAWKDLDLALIGECTWALMVLVLPVADGPYYLLQDWLQCSEPLVPYEAHCGPLLRSKPEQPKENDAIVAAAKEVVAAWSLQLVLCDNDRSFGSRLEDPEMMRLLDLLTTHDPRFMAENQQGIERAERAIRLFHALGSP